ncbi:hypothetical protein FPZ12_030705 [Amycolatopsis acidicola]|uniref:DUF7847 domain-containing protein n=1 Tax=Amycolatopsis acidicola TaxID=2596893 RepID=A0A5N0UW56_9PSEU|nr:hypothetical protein [Amycolatopsis acidicola]KAA9155034.1 hypothetical protein FPZ12_030705 [Amycolatopsis acidicola]
MSEPGGWTNPDQPGGDLPPAPPPQRRDPVSGFGKPGVIPLRPLRVGEILDGAVATMRRYPGLVFGVSAVVAIVSVALNFGADYWLLSNQPTLQAPGAGATEQEQLQYLGDVFKQSSSQLGIALVISVLARTFLSGFMTVVVGKAVLGRPVTFGEAWAELRPRLLALFGVTVLFTIMVAVGAAIFLIPGVLLYVLFSLAAPALVLEQSTLGESLRRSRALVWGNWWRVFGILLLTVIAQLIIGSVIQIPFNLQGSLTGADVAGESMGAQLLSALGSVVAQTVIAPFVAGATALLYIDQRMRREGMDIQLARAAGAR